MCFCCCQTRQTINIILLIITLSIFVYSSITIITHASNTILYETFENRLESVKPTSKKHSSENDNSNTNTNNNDDYNRDEELNNYILQNFRKYVDSPKDINSYYYISTLNYYDLEENKHDVLKALRGIEKGFGITFIVLHILFLIFIISFLCNSCGDREYTLSSLSTFNSLMRIKIICISLSILLIFLSLAYSILLFFALTQYVKFITNPQLDTFIEKIIVGMSYGIYSLYYYITLSCGFWAEKNLYFQLGYEGNPGKFAKFYKDGTPVRRHIPASSSHNILIFNHDKKEISGEPPPSKDPINAEELQIEKSKKSKKKQKKELYHDGSSKQMIIFSSSKDGKYLYYNGETYMKMNTTFSPPTN